MVLMSPVDGADPFGILQHFVITPGEKVNFTIPTLQIVTGLDPSPGKYILNTALHLPAFYFLYLAYRTRIYLYINNLIC